MLEIFQSKAPPRLLTPNRFKPEGRGGGGGGGGLAITTQEGTALPVENVCWLWVEFAGPEPGEHADNVQSVHPLSVWKSCYHIQHVKVSLVHAQLDIRCMSWVANVTK